MIVHFMQAMLKKGPSASLVLATMVKRRWLDIRLRKNLFATILLFLKGQPLSLIFRLQQRVLYMSFRYLIIWNI